MFWQWKPGVGRSLVMKNLEESRHSQWTLREHKRVISPQVHGVLRRRSFEVDSHSAVGNDRPKEEVVNSKPHATECSLESWCFRTARPVSSETDDCKHWVFRAGHASAPTPTIQQASHHHLRQSRSRAEAPDLFPVLFISPPSDAVLISPFISHGFIHLGPQRVFCSYINSTKIGNMCFSC